SPQLPAAVLLPPWAAALIAGLAMLLDERLRVRDPWSQVLFNAASTSTSLGLAALVADTLGLTGDRLGSGDWRQVLGFFLVAGVYYVGNTLPVAGIVAILHGGSFWRLSLQQARSTAAAEFALAVVGGIAAFVWVK